MKISQKQKDLQEAYKSGKFKVLALGGGAGSAKTIGILLLLHGICKAIEGVRIAVFRKSEKNLKTNTIPSYRKVLMESQDSRNVHLSNMRALYPNGSEILFLWADSAKDMDLDNVKGGEYTIMYFNEANQIDPGYFEIAKTRTGRWNKFIIDGHRVTVKPAIFLDFNPTNNWVKEMFYDPYQAGTLPDWIYFQLSLPSDNPFLEEDYKGMLETLPEAEYKRFVLGDWSYGDDPNQLIQYAWLRQCMGQELDEVGPIKLGVDVARYGDDSAVIAYARGLDIFRFEEFKKINPVELAYIVIERMREYGVVPEDVIVDVVGLGAGTVDTLAKEGFEVVSYDSGGKPNSTLPFFSFLNLRAEAHWMLRIDIEEEILNLVHSKKFVEDATTIRYRINNKVISIENKDELKKRLGRSPDFLDAAVMVNYLRHHAPSTLTPDNTFVGRRLEGMDIYGGGGYLSETNNLLKEMLYEFRNSRS